jgi:hypothetical protein
MAGGKRSVQGWTLEAIHQEVRTGIFSFLGYFEGVHEVFSG